MAASAASASAASDVTDMVGSRLLDNAAVALAAVNRSPVRHARLLALGYPHPGGRGATLFGLPGDRTFHCEWAALANGVAVRELDMHDCYLAADYSHPGDTIPGILAVAQQTGAAGGSLAQGILTAYETQMALVTGICLHEHRIDHVAHLAPAVAAGIGTMLHLDAEVIFQAINQSVPPLQRDATIAQGRHYELEGVCAGTGRKDGDRSGRSRPPWRARALTHLRGTRWGYRLAAFWSRIDVRRAAAC